MQSSSFRFARSACTTFLISTSFLSIADGSSSRPSCCFNYLYPLHNSSQRTGTDSALESRFTDPCTRQEIRSSSTRTRQRTNYQVKSGPNTSFSALTMNLDPTKPSSNALDPRTTSTSTQDNNNNINVITTENEHDDSVEKSDEQIHIHTHYIFLIHGWLGNSSEMSYIETSINQAAEAAAVVAAKNGNPNARIVTHCAKSNDKRTTDGISHGGTRLADEILQFITNDAKKHFSEEPGEREREHHVSISFVGNSLGGLYGRYALSKLPTQLCLYFESDDEGNKSSPKSSIILHREIFATTATPHLGCASHTFVSIPRVLEQVIGRTLKDTGKDLFRIDSDDLIYQMCTDYDLYLKPLSLFRKRIAYANAFRTDFQVPTGTAAFLSRHSTYPHSIQCVEESDPYPPFIVAVANTDVNHDILREENPVQGKKHAMSVKLDASGWEKVFVDVRDYIPTPGFALPSFMKKNSRSRWNQFITSKGVRGVGAGVGDGDGDDEKLKLVQVQSRELENLMKGSDRFEIPFGHQVMVANSKSEAYSSFTKGGRPVMDHMAQQMVKILLQ